MPDHKERARLTKTYEQLRERHLDMSLRNPMLSYKHRPTSKRQLQIVDEVPDEVYRLLTVDGASMDFVGLPEPDETPLDERTEEFRAALDHAKVADLEHLTRLRALESAGRDDEFALAEAERELRDRIRAQLGLPPRPNRKTINPIEHARQLGIDPSVELQAKPIKEQHSDRKLQTLKWPTTLDAVLAKISDDARLSEQESGLSTLFLVFGFLEWAEREDSAKRLFAPLLLLPVKLEKRRTGRGKMVFTLAATAESADQNLSLKKKLERDFARELPAFNDSDDTEAVKAVVEKYFAQVSKAINGMKGWNVRRWMTLGHFTSGRFAMYADLAPDNWSTHPVADELVGSIVRGTEISGDGGSSLLHPPEDYPIDEPEVEKVAPVLIHDADASQHSALVDVMTGQHLVIQGPPGTGKSQTITNIIANALAANKTVLFLAEKQAALDVVKRRLDRAGLGEFCLELHSDKATPKRIIESLKLRYKLGFGKSLRASASQSDATWLESRRELSAYVSALHAPAEDDKSPFDLIWRAIRARAEVGPVLQQFKTITLPQELLDSPATYQQVLGAVSVYARMASDFVSAYGPLAQSPWNALTFADLNPAIAYGLIDDLADLRQQANRAADLLTQAADLGVTTLADLEQLIDLDQSLSRTLPEPALVARVATLEAEQVEELIALRSALTNFEQAAGQTGSPVPVSDEIVALVYRLVEATTGTAWAGLPPDAIYAAAARQIADATQTKELVAALQPAFQILGLKDSFPANGIQAVFHAVYAATKLTDETRPWFVWRPEGGAEAFDRARLKWAALAAAEAQWRGRFPGYTDPAWPPPDGLRAAAAVAKKGTFGRMLGAFSGDAKVLTEIVARLGLPAGTKLAAADLEALAEHAQALAAFLNDRSCQQMLGSAWKGLDTPFELIAAARNFRGAAAAKIKECPNGYQVLNGLTDLDATGLVQLAATYGTVKRVADAGPELPALDDRGLAQIAAEVAHSRALAEVVLAVDPERRLRGIELPLPVLHQHLVVETKLHSLRSQIDAHPLSAEVERLAGCDADVQVTRAALTWVQAVRSHTTMPAPVREALLSESAQVMRDRMAALAAHAGPVVSDLKGVGARIECSHGVTGFDLTAPHTLIAVTADLAPRRDELTEYLSLKDQRQILADRGLAPLLNFADEVGVTADLLPALFSGLVSQRRAEQSRRTDPVLARAAGLRIEARRSEFVERDKRKIEADRRRVRDTLLTAIPPKGSRYGSRKTWTEMELLNNEFGKEKRFTPVRDLMGRAGEAIQTMKPCFMMSPLSLAKFLPAGALTFDLVVIDEASQMRPEDALGGLLRSQQLVVVGDQKQLPPTSFFSRAGDNTSAPTDDEDEFEDLDDESILEACQKTFRQTRLLRWHYRSRCESLIAFSNREFYRGELITFPMARPGSFSVDLIQVNGSYEAKRNPAEAQRVAEAAIAFMRQFADADPATIPTLGIVAVNTDQRDLIFEEIRQLEADDALVEQYREKVASKGEPVFIKNLENVQGDERDFIFISMTYGPKPGQRAVLQRFGPINGKQGHRRLNVLFSRARIRIGLFTSMGSADIKPGATSSEGVHVLKRYLAYAEERGRAAVDHLGGEPDSDFEVEVAGRLRARGYSVDLQVGVSGFRIDLGVRHPDHPERYLAGVECDGARYHSSRSARDRDRLRQEVLEGLGWDIVRVWSTDWFDNPDLQTDRLVSRLEELRAKPIPAHEDYTLAGHLHPDGPYAPSYVGSDEIGEQSSAAPEPARLTEPENAVAIDTAMASGDTPDRAGSGAPMAVSASLLDGSGPLTEAELHQALRELRDMVIAVEMAPWEHHRSILRDSMIETLIAQQVTDPSDWFLKVPQFQRAGTNPIEKTRYLDRICDLVARMSDRRPVKPPPAFTLTPPTEPQVMRQGTLFGAAGSSSNLAASPAASPPAPTPTPAASNGHGSDRYVVADISACGVDPNPDRFYEAGYSPALSRMIAHVIDTEGPLYADQLVTRIARAHGFMRSGAKIVERVMLAIDRRFPRSHEGEREVLWPAGSTPQPVLPLRRSKAEDRDHNDIPLAELASLAAARLRRREDEANVVAHMRQHFGLARLHDSTRARFEAAIRIAQEHLS